MVVYTDNTSNVMREGLEVQDHLQLLSKFKASLKFSKLYIYIISYTYIYRHRQTDTRIYIYIFIISICGKLVKPSNLGLPLICLDTLAYSNKAPEEGVGGHHPTQ